MIPQADSRPTDFRSIATMEALVVRIDPARGTPTEPNDYASAGPPYAEIAPDPLDETIQVFFVDAVTAEL